MQFKRSFFSFFLGISALSGLFSLRNSAAAPPQNAPLAVAPKTAPPVVMGYYPTYRSAPAPTEIRFNRFTHIIHSFLSVDANGKITPSAKIPDSALISAAHAQGVKVLLALGGGSNGKNFGAMVRSPTESAQFLADVVKIMRDSGADGLAVDWEQPTADDKSLTTEFIARLRKQTRAARPDSLLVLVVNAKPNNSKGYDGPQLRDNVDFLQVMTYDFHGPWSHAGHHTALYETRADTVDGKVLSFPAVLSYWRDVQGFRASQIVFGLAAYGRGFKVRDWGEKPTAPSQYPEISFRDVHALIGHGWTAQWDAEAHAPWLLSADKTDRISYDDERSAAEKARWMKQNGLPGFFIWELSQEVVDGDNLLTVAAQKAWDDTTN